MGILRSSRGVLFALVGADRKPGAAGRRYENKALGWATRDLDSRGLNKDTSACTRKGILDQTAMFLCRLLASPTADLEGDAHGSLQGQELMELLQLACQKPLHAQNARVS